jgi:hypothetical protein
MVVVEVQSHVLVEFPGEVGLPLDGVVTDQKPGYLVFSQRTVGSLLATWAKAAEPGARVVPRVAKAARWNCRRVSSFMTTLSLVGGNLFLSSPG